MFGNPVENLGKYETELIVDWLKDMKDESKEYKEPFLDTKVTVFINLTCSNLQQDIHVFVRTVDLLEEYITKKNSKKENISDPSLSIAAIIFITSKYIGEPELKIKYLERILWGLTQRQYDARSIKLLEMDVLNTLENKLPVRTVVDDLNTLVAMFERELKIKVTLIPVCLDTLEMLYMTRKEWFFQLKSMYSCSKEALVVFEGLMCSRYYLPIGILGFVIKNSKYTLSLDTDSILRDLAARADIHIDHIESLVAKIYEVNTTSED